ncbi:RagB/SusD family nutrient uptake outer membrane protein [Hymenobacter lapidiphilus]|uniref:RagB/SusD family nutrient uptake outer membrane protein n=1 Tax=Hymenobacter sp. CCM 8763 TaxID=2303334 RepID=UPI000E3427DE|nr:RagB/SusD family nutrient uptake outer membrane protein [Hymenobacter sp. CCM 8763]RFP64657.1 RagB/SusD family nutrient uptake outer membrane protein [Hymenobacter sp. CCM 8763]
MKNLRLLAALPLAALALTGCEQFLDVKPKGLVVPQQVTDYELILNSPALTQTFPSALLYMSDDGQDLSLTRQSGTTLANAYFWNPSLDVEQESSPLIWGTAYRSIYNTNVIIGQVLNATDGTPLKRQQVLGEALVMRADLYFNLLTVFAKAYNPATAATDPGVPFVTGIDVTDTAPPRAPVQTVLDTLRQNLLRAAAVLPPTNISRARVTKYVAYGLLARISLYMQDYAGAKRYAESALQAPHKINDYNEFVIPLDSEDPELLWIRQADDVSTIFYLTYSPELLALFEPDDLRPQLLAFDIGTGFAYGRFDYGIHGIGFAEMELIRAEALARAGQAAEALAVLETLREKRIDAGSYEPLEVGTGPEALDAVLLERRRELPFRGTRWQDMKRIDQQKRMPAVQRIGPDGQVLETLAPQSPRYTFEIPARVLRFNPGMVRNNP